jgi:geranylgeranyl diphosphate synthase type II
MMDKTRTGGLGAKMEREAVTLGRANGPIGFQDDLPPGNLWSADYLRMAIDRRLKTLVSSTQGTPRQLHQAMGYSLLAPGKRLRPLLTLLTSFHFGIKDLAALDAACAIEMIHAASLIMDDLPSMDNAALRRGQPTAHLKFGEDIAILSGIALLNQAFGVIASAEHIGDSTRVDLVRVLSNAVGGDGLVGGQVLDLRERTGEMARGRLEKLNKLKTAALFVASVEAGALVARVPHDSLDMVRQFALELGLAFQIADDLLDDPTFAGKTGKDTGKDTGKSTLQSVLGKGEACRILGQHLCTAHDILGRMGKANSPLNAYVESSFAQFHS